MKLKFLKTAPGPGANGFFAKGETYEVKNRHAAEVCVAHGYAVVVDQAEAGDLRSTLKREYPVRKGTEGTEGTAATEKQKVESKK